MSESVRSMTGFGRAEAELERGAVSVEVRSVNGRHLELRVRLPRELSSLEAKLRRAASAHFARGQVEVSIRLPREGVSEPELQIDQEAAKRYAEAGRELSSALELDDSLSISSLLALPGVARMREPELQAEAIGDTLLQAVEAACLAACKMREREGLALADELLSRITGVEERVQQFESRAEEITRGLRERLQKRLATLAPEVEVDPARLEQEIVIYADKLDITEELVRLRSHCAQFRETLDGGGSIGRKLEFLLQECGRETNTIGSKASDAPIARDVVELKTELEKIREQVLNVE